MKITSALHVPRWLRQKRIHLKCWRPGSISGLGRSPGGGHGNPLYYSCLKASIDYIVHEVAKSQTRLGDFPFHFINIYIELLRGSNYWVLSETYLNC